MKIHITSRLFSVELIWWVRRCSAELRSGCTEGWGTVWFHMICINQDHMCGASDWNDPHRWCADLAETPRTWSWRPRGSKRAARTCCPSWTFERRLPSGKDAGQKDWKRRTLGDVFCQSHFNNCMNEVLLSWSSGTCLHLCLHLYLHWPGLWRMIVWSWVQWRCSHLELYDYLNQTSVCNVIQELYSWAQKYSYYDHLLSWTWRECIYTLIAFMFQDDSSGHLSHIFCLCKTVTKTQVWFEHTGFRKKTDHHRTKANKYLFDHLSCVMVVRNKHKPKHFFCV